MAKAMMFTKKKPVDAEDTAADEAADPTDTEQNDEGADDGDTVKCPNCETVFNDETMKIEKMGLPVIDDGKPDNEGAALELPPAPDGATQFGAAHDAAGGEGAIAAALSAFRPKAR